MKKYLVWFLGIETQREGRVIEAEESLIARQIAARRYGGSWGDYIARLVPDVKPPAPKAPVVAPTKSRLTQEDADRIEQLVREISTAKTEAMFIGFYGPNGAAEVKARLAAKNAELSAALKELVR